MLWYLVFILLAILAYIKLLKPHKYWKDRNVLYVKPLPLFGNSLSLILRNKTACNMLQDQYNAYNARYYGTYMFLKPTLFLKDIELIKQLYIKDFDHFVDRNVFLSEDVMPLFAKSLFFLSEQRWRNMRATLSPAFTSSKMRSMFALITECAENLVNHFTKTIPPNEIKTIEMKDITSRYANDVIANCAFGIQCDSLNEPKNEFYIMGKDISSFRGWRAVKILLYLFIPFIMKLLPQKLINKEKMELYFRDLVFDMMKMREKNGIIRPDMIHLLMEAKKGKLKYEEVKQSDAGFATVEESNIGKQEKENFNLTDEDLAAQAFLFFAAGFETTSSVLSFMSYELALNEDVQRKLQDEIDEVMEENNGKISYEIILKMKYLDMVISETLRKWPPAPGVERKCIKPYTIEPKSPEENPLLIEKGMVTWIAIYPMHRDPKYFPDPDKFDPERFSDENKHNIVPFSYIPFGIGPRNCIGSRFALLEMKAMFVNLLAKFDLVVVKETQIPLKIEKTSFNINAENGFWLGLKQRVK